MDPLAGLTDAQREAVTHVEGPLLILAGPGSGKTRVVTHRIAYMLGQGIRPQEILALTFTNKAADEMRARVERLAPDAQVWLGTFHRFCARLLRRYAPLVGLEPNYTIYDADDALRALRQTLSALKVDPQPLTPEAVLAAISWAKNNIITPENYEPRAGNLSGTLVHKIYPRYQARLRASNAVDFDDLLFLVAVLLRDNPQLREELDERYRFVLVDEYQDTNLAQYAIARALSINHPNLAATGDPDQSIYGWRGANLHNILEFERDFPDVRVVRLERNYRSTKAILRVAAELIRYNVKRKEKGLFTENGEGQPVALVRYPTQRDEAQQIAETIAAQIRDGRRRPRDFAVFYRVNALSRSFEIALREAGVPFQLVQGLEFFQRKEIKDVIGYLQLLNNPRDEQALLRVINTPARGIGQRAIERLQEHAARHGTSLLEAARDAAVIESLNKRTAKLLGEFVALFDRLTAALESPVEELMGLVLTETGYQERLKASGDPTDQDRLANIEELLTVARQFDEQHFGPAPLEAFLEEASLTSDTDAWESENDRVTLMTLHGSKGLEFPVVFLTAVEEGLLPHERSRQNADQLEEERRLMFVGITRAQEELQISTAEYRDFRGQRKMTVPSQFLMELPRGEMAVREVGNLMTAWSGRAEIEGFDDDYDADEFTPAAATLAPAAPVGPSIKINGLNLKTAAEMHGQTAAPVSPEVFHQGMVVRHPSYGLGKIVALSGSGSGRTATVDFAAGPGRVKFLLQKSPLRPLRRNGEGQGAE